MGIYNGAGIHGTDDTGSIGSAASHGCIRMLIPDVEDLFDRVEVGTRSTSAEPRSGCLAGARARRTSQAWPGPEALAAFARDLHAGASLAERTRRAYAVDLDQFAGWAESAGWGRPRSGTATCAAMRPELSSGGAPPATVARKLAAIRGFFDFLVRSERIGANPADLVASPKREQKLPRVLTREEMESLLERIPARTPLELRDRAMLELAYSCGLRCEEIVNLDLDSLDFEGEHLRVEGKGGKSGCCRSASRRSARCAAISSAGPPRRSPPIRRSAGPRSSPRAAAGCSLRPAPAARLWVRDAAIAGGVSPHACATPSPPICSRAEPTCARSRSCSASLDLDHPGLHPRGPGPPA